MAIVIEDLEVTVEPEPRSGPADGATAAPPAPSAAAMRDQIRSELARAEVRAARLRAD